MSATPARVLITRSEPGASETAARLFELGLEPIVEPVFYIVDLPALLPEFDALAFTSANAVRRFASLSSRRDARVFAVGGKTAKTAQEAGFRDVISADGDVTALVDLVRTDLAPGARLLHSGNRERRGDLVERLRDEGLDAAFVATYAPEPIRTPGPVLSAHLQGEKSFDAALVHSPKGGAILASFLAAAARRTNVRIAAISKVSADALQGLAEDVEVASSPDENALLAALQRILQRA